MRPVKREEILPLELYERSRDEIRPIIIEAKRPRRVHVGEHLMVKAERMTRDADIRHELETYNELLGGRGELGATLLIELTDAAVRDVKLREWLGLERHLYLKLSDGTKVRARFDERQVAEDRLSSVQYLKFDVQGRTPLAAGSDLPALVVESPLSAEQQAALRQDLASDA